MESVPVFVGLDYHSKSVQVCAVDAAGKVRLNRRVPGCVELVADAVASLGRVEHVGIEACSGAAVFAEELHGLTGWRVSLSNPVVIARMKPTLDKTDRSDARVLADLCRTGYLPTVWLAPEPIRQLRQLTDLRRQHVQAGKNAKLRILALLRELRVREPEECGRWSRKHLAWLKDLESLPAHSRWVLDRLVAELEHQALARRAVERRLREATDGDRVVARLLELPGVGEVTAWLLRAVVGDFARFRTGKQLAKYCGLSPRNVSSGEKFADAGLIKAGDGTLKATLVQAAHRLVRYEERWKRLFLSMLERGKARPLATAAVANRWVRWLYHQVKSVTQEARCAEAAAA